MYVFFFLQHRQSAVSVTMVTRTPITKPIIHPIPNPVVIILSEHSELETVVTTVGLAVLELFGLVLTVSIDRGLTGFTPVVKLVLLLDEVAM